LFQGRIEMDKMEFNGKATYFVAVKVFLRDGGKLLVVHDAWGTWELPGGRIRLEEFQRPLGEVVGRKIREELGDKVKYSGLKPTGTFFQVRRFENIGGESEQEVRIFAIGFEAQYEDGEIELGGDHDEMRWVNVGNFEPLKLQDNDWMRGVEDYLWLEREEK